MQSSNLLPALRELPGGEYDQHRSIRDHITGIVNMDRAMYAAEFASAISAGMWGIFGHLNVDDRLLEAYETRWPNMSDEISLYDKVRELTESGELTGTDNWLFYGLKGQLAEFETNRLLESDGWTHLTLAPTTNNPFWDNIGINPDGKVAVIQTKTRADSTSDVQSWMAEDHPNLGEHPNLYEKVQSDVQQWVADPEIVEKHPELTSIAERLADGPDSFVSDRYLALGSEIINKSTESGVDAAGRIIADIGPDYQLVEGITDGLSTLSDNMGIDIPDSVGEIIPYASAIFATARLIANVIKTEKEFKAADRTTKNKIQVIQTLTLLSRMGPKTVLSIIGGKGGAMGGGAVGGIAGTVVPGVGNAIGGLVGVGIGGIGGAVVGYKVGSYLSKHLEPHALNIALDITHLTSDDLFYFKNRPRIDDLAATFQRTSRELTAAPAV